MALEDKILQVLGRGAMTWDGLRAELGATPGDLDAAIRHLETAREIARDRGRFHLNGAEPPPQQIAAATETTTQPMSDAMTTKTKTCSKCSAPKPLDQFSKHPATKDGYDSRCKECVKRAAQARKLAKQGGSAAATPAKASAVVLAPKASFIPPVMILHFQDGVRIGPVHTSAAGVAQMPYHVDISAEQLDELTTWWLASKKDVA